jgi:DNA-binding PadR family transcriptional regulator
MKRLSDLEMAILGIVWKRAPCTSYVVAKEFFTSPSSHWRGSVGAVYPAIARLRRLGLLKQHRVTLRGRICSRSTLTPKGLKTLRQWLSPPLPSSAAAITFDPIRTRAFFLGVLTKEQQRAFLREAERQMMAQVPVLEAEVARYQHSGDWFSEQAQRGALHVMTGRLAWIQEFKAALNLRLNRPKSRKEKANEDE